MLLLFAEHQNGRLIDATLEAVGMGRTLADKAGEELAAALLGSETCLFTATLGDHGIDRIFLCEDSRLDGYAPEATVHTLVQIVRQHAPKAVLFADNSWSGDIAVRLAARLKAAFAPRCAALSWNTGGCLQATRPTYADRLQAVVVAEKAPLIVTLQEGVGEVKRAPRSPQVEEIALRDFPDSTRARLLHTLKADPRTMPLTQAEFIVSGGNGVRDFAVLWELADRLGAAVGGSRVVCDDGRLPRDRQIGESGTIVRPRCYLAFGISGASQHLRGMQDSKLIIAVNTDRHAPLMKLANMAVVGDAEQVIRAMLERLDTGD